MRAYWDLATEKIQGSSIPWSKIIEYGERSGLDSIMIEVLLVVTRTLEARYIRWAKGERERRELVEKPSPAQRAKTMSSKRG